MLISSVTATLENSLMVLTKLNIFLPYNITIILLGFYLKELIGYVHAKTCT